MATFETMSTIEQQFRELVDRSQIEQLVSQYAHAVRTKDLDWVMSLYADDGISVDFESAIEGTAHTQGTEAVKKVYEEGFPNLGPWPMFSNLVIEFQSPTEASGQVLLEFRRGTKDYRNTCFGFYHDTYVKQAGVWKFKSRKATVTYTADA